VDEGVAHAPEGGVDRDVGELGDLAEGELGLVPHEDDLALLRGELLDGSLDLLPEVGAVEEAVGLGRLVGEAVPERRAIVVVARRHVLRLLAAAEVVEGGVARDPHDPRQPPALLLVGAAAVVHGLDGAEERVLEEVGGDAAVAHHPHEVPEDPLLVALDELGEGPLVAPVEVGGDELLGREAGHEEAMRAVGGTGARGPYCARATRSRPTRTGGAAGGASGRKRRPRPRRSTAPAGRASRRTRRHARRTGRPGSTSSKATQAPGARCGRIVSK